MPQSRLLLLDDSNHLSAYRWQRGRLLAESKFSADAAGTEAFKLYLGAHAGSLYSILADVAEESYQIEEVPFVSGRDRSALLQRRLAQYFYGTPLTLAMPLGRDKSGRRDEKILFAALTQPRHFEPWLDIMRGAGAQLAGIYSTPLALASLLEHKRELKGPQLVLSISRSGVRQTFFNDGKLYFSRLAALATGTLEEAAISCAIEANKIYQYLVGQRLIKRGTPLSVQILAHPAQTSAIQAHCRNSAELSFAFVDLLVEARKAGLKSPLADSFCEPLLLHQLQHRRPHQQFAPPAERHFYRLWQIRFALTAAAFVVFSGCLLFAGRQYVDTYRLKERTTTLLDEAQYDRGKYEAALGALPKVSIGNEDVRALVGRFDELEKHSPQLESIYFPLSRALDATPGINIERIDWKASANAADSTTQASSSGNAQAQATNKTPKLDLGGNYFAIADVTAQLPVAIANDHRAMLQMVNQLIAELGKESSIRVQMTQMPFDIESGKTIKGSADASVTQAEAPRLSFRIVRAIQ